MSKYLVIFSLLFCLNGYSQVVDDYDLVQTVETTNTPTSTPKPSPTKSYIQFVVDDSTPTPTIKPTPLDNNLDLVYYYDADDRWIESPDKDENKYPTFTNLYNELSLFTEECGLVIIIIVISWCIGYFMGLLTVMFIEGDKL